MTESDELDWNFDIADRSSMLDAIMAEQPEWERPNDVVMVGSTPWTPDLVGRRGEICYLHLGFRLLPAFIRRIQAALELGRPVTVAAPLQNLMLEDTLSVIDELGAQCTVLHPGNGNWTAKTYRSVPLMIAESRLVLRTDIARNVALRALERSRKAQTSNERGWRFEHFLCLVFSQVRFFEVVAHNYRNETEEIDVILSNRYLGGPSISPIAVASAKNLAIPVGVPALTKLEEEMRNRRGQCHLGFLCSMRRIAGTVETHLLRSSRESRIIVLLDGQELQGLVQNIEQIDDRIERLVLGAVLQ